eukprot:1793861-Amphidinium_carterae.1
MKLGGDGKVVCTHLSSSSLPPRLLFFCWHLSVKSSSGIEETFFKKKKVNRGGFLGRTTKGDDVKETRVACAVLHGINCQAGHETIVLGALEMVIQPTGFHKETGTCPRGLNTDGAPAYNFLEKRDRLAANTSSCVLSACHHTSRLFLVVEVQALHRHPHTGPVREISERPHGVDQWCGGSFTPSSSKLKV